MLCFFHQLHNISLNIASNYWLTQTQRIIHIFYALYLHKKISSTLFSFLRGQDMMVKSVDYDNIFAHLHREMLLLKLNSRFTANNYNARSTNTWPI